MTGIVRRLGSCSQVGNCPAILELDTGDYLIIGTPAGHNIDLTGTGAGIDDSETAVILPASVWQAAARDWAQQAYVPPPPGPMAEKIPGELLAIIDSAPYLSTACDAARRLKAAAGREASYVEDRVIDQLVKRARILHQRCRLNNKFTGAPCRCACHQEARS